MRKSKPSKLLIAMDNGTLTLNGAPTLKSTLNYNLDFFSRAGAMRGQENAALVLFLDAKKENPALALKNLFHLRNIRGGAGERELFRYLFKTISDEIDDFLFKRLIEFVPEYGRWDDLFVFFGTDRWQIVRQQITVQLYKDCKNADSGKPFSLLAKWLPSETSRRERNRAIAKDLIANTGFTPKEYRQTLSILRKKLRIVERQMSANEWREIDYSVVPSRAAMIYRQAFSRHDGERYNRYIRSVLSGEKKINAAVLYPHELVALARKGNNETIDALWKNLKLDVRNGNVLVMADVSGSMEGKSRLSNVTPIDVSIGMALFLAERIVGPFQNHFITFTSQPTLQKINGSTLRQKISSISGPIGYDTNLQAAFNLVLNTAIEYNLSQKEMPEYILVITDMEFNTASVSGHKTNFGVVKAKYKAAGYDMPKLIFWNVDAKTQQSPVAFNENNIGLVSGYSPAIVRNILADEWTTPEELMLQTLSQYDIMFA